MPPGENPKIVSEARRPGIPSNAGGARPYQKRLNDVRWHDIRFLLRESFENWNRHNDTRLGASLAFYSLLSLAPLVLLLVSIAGLVFGHKEAARAIVRDAQAAVGPVGAHVVREFLLGSHAKAHGVVAGVVSLVTLFFTASGVLIELHSALNTVWEVPNSAISGLHYFVAYLKQRLVSFASVLALGFLLIISLAITTLIASLGAFSAMQFPSVAPLLQTANAMVSFVVISGVFAAIYKIVPDVRLQWRDVILGGAVTSLLFTIGKLFLGLYLGRASYTSIYGAAASIVVAMAWTYYSSQIFFLGAEFTRSFAQHYGSLPAAGPKQMTNLAPEATSDKQPEDRPSPRDTRASRK
jgi:membrane protein